MTREFSGPRERLRGMTDRQILLHAAHEFTRLAADIRYCHTTRAGTWPRTEPADVQARLEHDIARALARRLRRIASGAKRRCP